jgi:predicted amidohydrolase YtcJ
VAASGASDAHHHLLGLEARQVNLRPNQLSSIDDLLQRVKARAEELEGLIRFGVASSLDARRVKGMLRARVADVKGALGQRRPQAGRWAAGR